MKVFTEQDKKFMQKAIDLAEKGRGRTNPNPMVGAVIVRDGEVISTGYHKKAGTLKRRHGQKVKTTLKPDHRYQCDVCHTDDYCKKCHQRQRSRPKDHTGFWRTRGHGLKAIAKRDSCINCHNEIFCIRCHKNTKPMNHRGAWSSNHSKVGSQYRRCSVCHPRVISRIHVGNSPDCNRCHPQ